MTPEELLRPRYKVIADYPGNTDKIGHIFFANPIGWSDSEKYWSKYPHLFKKLEWWEERTYMELPDCIAWYDPSDKTALEPTYFEVIGWTKSPNTSEIIGIHTHDAFLFIKDCKPATEAEYIAFKQSSNIKA